MQIVDGDLRFMRLEMKKRGTPRDTDEVRDSYDFGSLKASLTYLPPGETQDSHKHFLLREATQVLLGEVQVSSNDTWYTLKERQGVKFDPGEYHNMRAPPGATGRISYP